MEKLPKLTVELARKIITRIVERLPDKRMPNCPICTKNNWELARGFVSLSLSEDPRQAALGGTMLPCAVIVCRVCGNTVLMNLIALELDEIVSPDPAELKIETHPPEVKVGPSTPSGSGKE